MDNVSVCERRNHGGRVLAQEVTHILDQVLGGAEPLSILDLQGLGKSAWAGTDAVAHVDAARFLSEIKTTAKLQHPHILPLLDSGAADGLLFYVMPYVRGETLRARLERETWMRGATSTHSVPCCTRC